MTQAKEASLRRVAIVLQSLPESVAIRLLGSLHGEAQREIRSAIGSLADVDPLERRRALDGFVNNLRDKQSSHPASAGQAAEVVFSRTAIRNLHERISPPVPDDSPLGFLREVDDDALVAHLMGELPQTLAIILAGLAPAHAARLLPKLSVTVRAEAMRRMATLSEIPQELIEEIATQLRTRLVSLAGAKPSAGRRALNAIMAEIPQPDAAPPVTLQTPASLAAEPLSANSRPTLRDDSVALRIAPGTEREAASSRLESAPVASRTAPSTPLEPMETVKPKPLASSDSIHAYLVAMPTERLKEGLGQVETRQALLALCGLPKSVADAVLSTLPRKQAKQVREQIVALGALELREIDRAKEAVAEVLYLQNQPTPAKPTPAKSSVGKAALDKPASGSRPAAGGQTVPMYSAARAA